MCPGHCRADDLQVCVDHAKRCHDGQFCKISQDEHGLKGECKDDHELHHCQDEMRHHDCDGHGPHEGPHGPHCVLDCCTTNDCLQGKFGSVLTTQAPPTTPAAATSNATLWDKFKGDCKDQVANDGCKTLVKTQDVCHDRLALDICPDTCGLCSAINSTACQDTVVNGGCSDLQNNKDVCSDPLAVFICPQTCNMCAV
ncbi:uncharacterized protein LOC101861847 [Aplysia californica]|uniref:Uncharacterized protein LOC101861847 n=1 Tax=Aplysia californica TaxID=6500 RepID=A0ABM0K568_APLCA|nr:uncharacterized protein LOC101861847 [Aplysia californica]